MKDKETKNIKLKILNIIKSNLFNIIIAGLFILFGIVLYVIFRSNPDNFNDFTAISWLALVFVTGIYAFATIMILLENRRTIQEMKRARLDAVKPSLSLQPEDFFLGGGFSSLFLRNSGGVAKEVKVDIETTNPKSNKALFFPAIDRDHIAYLAIDNIGNIQRNGGLVTISINFKDSYNRILNDSFSINFSELKNEGRELRGQFNPLDSITSISGTLRNIEYKIDKK